jgi:hypothetical protein
MLTWGRAALGSLELFLFQMIVDLNELGHGLAEEMNRGSPFKKSSASFSIRLLLVARSLLEGRSSGSSRRVREVGAAHSS